MKKVLVLVEGQTEETVVRDTLNPHLEPRGIFLTSTILVTKREKSGKGFQGGVPSFPRVERHIRSLLGDSSAAAITTLIDYYGLPGDFPGLDSRPHNDPHKRVAHVENAFAEAVNDRRFIPHLTLHEIEAWVFVNPPKCASVLVDGPSLQADLTRRLESIRTECGAPEKIDEGPETAPSKRLLKLVGRYRKLIHGPRAIAEIGMAQIRSACPHADGWLRRLEALG